jgi:F-type H+-transporting ATPase subunit delta
MNAGTLSTRYAKAILRYASERGEAGRLRTEMQTLCGQFNALPLLRSVLEDPSLPADEKIRVLHAAAGAPPSHAYRQAVRLVVQNGREQYMQRIALAYDALYRKENNLTAVRLATAEPAGAGMLQAIARLAAGNQGGQVDFAATEDESLLGGFILEIEGYRLDASVRNQLNLLRQELIRH